MLSSSKATCALTSRACEWVEAFEKIVPLHLKLKSWTVNRWKSNVKKGKKFVKRPRTYYPKAERIQILGQIEPFAQKFQNL